MQRIEIEDLGLRLGDRWLFRHLTLSIPAGRFMAVVGPSGVGKTSLLSCLAGIREPTEGRIGFVFKDERVHGPGECRRQLGIIFQRLALSENASVLTNVLCGRLNRFSFFQTLLGFPRSEQQEAFEILHDLGLASYVHRAAGRVSGGEQQRVAIARALFQEPDVFLADEPVSQLDVYLTGRVLGMLKLQSREHRRAVLCVLHDPALVERFADFSLALDRNDPEKWHLREIHRKEVA